MINRAIPINARPAPNHNRGVAWYRITVYTVSLTFMISPVMNVEPVPMRAVKIPPKQNAIFWMYCVGIVLAMSNPMLQNIKAIVTQNGRKKGFSINSTVRLEIAAGAAFAGPASRNKPIISPIILFCFIGILQLVYLPPNA